MDCSKNIFFFFIFFFYVSCVLLWSEGEVKIGLRSRQGVSEISLSVWRPLS